MKCKSVLKLSDDYLDNECTITCDLEEGHDCIHLGEFRRESITGEEHKSLVAQCGVHIEEAYNVTVTWEGSDGD